MFSEIVAFECECASSDDEPSLRALAGGLTASVAALTGRPESIFCGSTCLSDAVVILCFAVDRDPSCAVWHSCHEIAACCLVRL